MRIIFQRTFTKRYEKLPVKVQVKFDERFSLWLRDPEHPSLRVHSLKGKYVGYFSLNVTGDIRALYRYEDDTIVIFALIGTHSELYG
jgi:addiction module RelE/StbE family toxin